VKKGDKVTIQNPSVMRNFESKTLKRTFDTIVFGTLQAPGAAAAAPATPPHGGGGTMAAAGGMGAMHGSMAKSIDVPVAKVAKAEGPAGRTVAEVNADRVALKDKPVAIRAQVVKVTPEVMGKNWIHLRDGSGSAGDGSNDVLVTSKELPKVGDVVLAKGTVRNDVDLGSGYAYKVLVEDAKFQK